MPINIYRGLTAYSFQTLNHHTIFLWRCQWPRQHQLQVEFHFGQVWGKDKFLGREGTFSHTWGQSKEERKESKERLKSSHRQARAPGVLSQARNYRTRSTAKCFIKGNSLPNSWRWASASCVCLLVSFFPFFSYLHLSIFYSLALCIGKAIYKHSWTIEKSSC